MRVDGVTAKAGAQIIDDELHPVGIPLARDGFVRSEFERRHDVAHGCPWNRRDDRASSGARIELNEATAIGGARARDRVNFDQFG